MAAPAANEAQPQGPQVPRVPQANVVQHILAERPPQKPILVFLYFASTAPAFRVHVSACSHLSLPCVYLRSFRSPLHLASWLTLFIALLSAFRADMYFILVFPAWEVLWFVCLFPHDRCYLF